MTALSALVLFAALQTGPPQTGPLHSGSPQSGSEGTIHLEDGTDLAHMLLRPKSAAPWPTLLIRSCYGRRGTPEAANDYLNHGIAVLMQDVRGTGKSSGEWRPFVNEAADGAATFDWIRNQPWSDGRVGALGTSYLGICAWQLAPHAQKDLSALAIHFASADVYRDVVHFGGVQGLAIGLSWILTSSGNRGFPRFQGLPLIDADDQSGMDLAAWNDWCRHPLLDDYWKGVDFAPRYAEVRAPALLVAGWYDLFQPGQIDDYMALSRRTGPSEQTFARLIVGPWDHGGFGKEPGRPDLGPAAHAAPHDEQREFIERFLLGIANGYEKKAGVRAFFLGENAWRELASWPPPDAVATDWFLSGGRALLSKEQVTTRVDPPDAFTYDPGDPCPSFAGNLWKPLSALNDQAEIAARPDVLVYQTAPLAQEVRIAGPVALEAWIVSDAPDTDLAATLVDVDPEGQPGQVHWRGEGIQRARTRDGPTPEKAHLLEPGVPARLVVRMGHMAARFPAGHRIAVHVTSSNFPRFSRNLNTAEPSNVAAKASPARNSVLHDAAHPSRLVLWQLPAPGAAGPPGEAGHR